MQSGVYGRERLGRAAKGLPTMQNAPAVTIPRVGMATVAFCDGLNGQSRCAPSAHSGLRTVQSELVLHQSVMTTLSTGISCGPIGLE